MHHATTSPAPAPDAPGDDDHVSSPEADALRVRVGTTSTIKPPTKGRKRRREQTQAPTGDGHSIVLYTPGEAGVRLGGCSENHVRRLIAAGELRAVNVAPPGSLRSKIRVRSDDLDAYIESQTTAAPTRRVSR